MPERIITTKPQENRRHFLSDFHSTWWQSCVEKRPLWWTHLNNRKRWAVPLCHSDVTVRLSCHSIISVAIGSKAFPVCVRVAGGQRHELEGDLCWTRRFFRSRPCPTVWCLSATLPSSWTEIFFSSVPTRLPLPSVSAITRSARFSFFSPALVDVFPGNCCAWTKTNKERGGKKRRREEEESKLLVWSGQWQDERSSNGCQMVFLVTRLSTPWLWEKPLTETRPSYAQ